MRAGWAGLLIVHAVICPGALDAQTIANEYRLKAAFVYQFPQFVEWPQTAWRETRDARLCVVPPNPFGRELERLVQGERLNGRTLTVKEIVGPDEVAGCHLLYVSSRAGAGDDILKAAAGLPVLTVGEADGFLDRGGIIAIRIVDRRVRFDVNTTNAQKAGLRISSQLLGLALSVREGTQ